MSANSCAAAASGFAEHDYISALDDRTHESDLRVSVMRHEAKINSTKYRNLKLRISDLSGLSKCRRKNMEIIYPMILTLPHR